MNPRIQVEHTVTEEITDVDLVQSQMRIAAGETLADLGLSQEGIVVRGAALQCRITTEDPANGFRPDTGKITTYRSPGGAGVRIDGGTTYTGAEVSAHFDSMLAKLTCRGRDLRQGGRAGPAGRRGVPHPRRLHQHRVPPGRARRPGLRRRAASPPASSRTHPHLLSARSSGDRGSKLLTYLADVTVNQPHGAAPVTVDPVSKLPGRRPRVPAPDGSRQHLLRVGPRSSRATCAPRTGSPSPTPPSATPTSPCSPPGCAPATCSPSPATSPAPPPSCGRLEAWGGATYDVALRFLSEDPWERLAAAARGGAQHLPPDAAARSQHRRLHAVPDRGHRGVRAPRRPRPASTSSASSTRSTTSSRCARRSRRCAPPARRSPRSRSATPATSRTPPRRSTPSTTTSTWPRRIVDAGAHVLAIKDMAGLLRVPAARTLVTALRERVRPPRAPAHPRHPRRPARHAPRGDRRRRRRRRRRLRVDGRHDVAAAAVRAGLGHRPRRRETGLSLAASTRWSPTGRPPAASTRPSSPGLPAPTGRVYRHEIPGGQLSNLRQQAIALGLGEKFEQVEDMYAAANDILGNVVKVTPSSKVVGDLALHLVAVGADPGEFEDDPGSYDIPDSVIGFLHGELGDPPGGWPEPFRTKALAGRDVRGRPPTRAPEQSARLTAGSSARAPRHPQPAALRRARPASSRSRARRYGDVSVLPTIDYLYGLRRGEEHTRRPRRGRAAADRARGDRRARRAGHPHGHVHAQRPDAPGRRPRPQRRLRGRGRREGRSGPRRPRRRSVRRCGHRVGVAEGDTVEAGDRRWRPSRR